MISKSLSGIDVNIARVPNGNYVTQVLATESLFRRPLKAHVEFNLKEDEFIQMLKSDQLWSGDYLRHMAHYVGYVGEAHVMRRITGNPPTLRCYPVTRGRGVAQAMDVRFEPGTVMTLQTRGGQGLDLIGKRIDLDQPRWVVIDTKSTARDASSYGTHGTPKTPPLSTAQKQGWDLYAKKTVNDALESFGNGGGPNLYGLSADQAKNLRAMLNQEKLDDIAPMGIKIRVGMQDGLAVSGNTKYPIPPGMVLWDHWF